MGNSATSRTVRRAVSIERSDAVRAYSTHSPPAIEAFETRSAAPNGWPPITHDTARMASGYNGKNAALPSPARYPLEAIRRNHSASNRSKLVKAFCHPGSGRGFAPQPGTETGLSGGNSSTATSPRISSPKRTARKTVRL